MQKSWRQNKKAAQKRVNVVIFGHKKIFLYRSCRILDQLTRLNGETREF